MIIASVNYDTSVNNSFDINTQFEKLRRHYTCLTTFEGSLPYVQSINNTSLKKGCLILTIKIDMHKTFWSGNDFLSAKSLIRSLINTSLVIKLKLQQPTRILQDYLVIWQSTDGISAKSRQFRNLVIFHTYTDFLTHRCAWLKSRIIEKLVSHQ